MIAMLRHIAGRSRKRELRDRDVTSVLLVELTRLGDVVAMIPAIPLLRAHFSHATIHVVVDESYASLLKGIQLDAEVHGVTRPGTYRGMLTAVNTVRRLKVDLAISMSPPKRNAAVTLVSGGRATAGYLQYAETHTPFLGSYPVEAFGIRLKEDLQYGGENIELRAMRICQAVGMEPKELFRQVTLRSDKVDAIRSRLLERGVLPSGKYVVVHPFSGWEFRTWDLNRFNVVVEEAALGQGFGVVFVCHEDEASQLRGSQRYFAGRRDVAFIASKDVLETAVVIAGGSLFLGNDSGPLHLASALGVRSVGLYGPALPSLTAPRSNHVTTLYAPVPCSPCDQRTCIRPDNPCMSLLSAEDVRSAVAESLNVIDQARVTAHA